MKPFPTLLAALLPLALAAPCAALAATPRPTSTPDTIIVKLPNQAVMTLYVKNKAQLHQLRTYKLDSLMGVLDDYITKAEAAGKNSTSDEVTMEYYPAKDHPGTGAPEQIRITVRSEDTQGQAKKPTADRVDVSMGRLFGVTVEDSNDGNGDKVSVRVGSTAKSDSVRTVERKAKIEEKANRSSRSSFGMDLGLNALVDKGSTPNTNGVTPELRPFGSRYVSLYWQYAQRLGGKRSPLYLLLGPEVAFNNYMLDNNTKFTYSTQYYDQPIIVAKETTLNLEKSKLATTTLNLPVMASLRFRGNNDHDGFRLSAGGFVGYRLSSHTKLKYEQDGNTKKDKNRGGYNLEDFQYGLQGGIGMRKLDLFVKYNLNGLFKENLGPQGQTISFGVSFFGI